MTLNNMYGNVITNDFNPFPPWGSPWTSKIIWR